MGNAQSAVATSPSPCFQEEHTTTIRESLRSFTLFTRLPLELQGKIWIHALEAPRITPHVVRVRHDATTNSFSYSFTIPHMMEVCRLSRQIAQKFYPSLLPGLPSPVYINPAVDFLYCTSTLDPSNSPGRVEDLPVLSFLSAASNAEAIRFLVLDLSFWSHRMVTTTAGTCPIPELRSFSTIEELFLVVPSLEQWLENQRRISAAFPHRPDDPRFDVDAKYAAEVARHEAAPDAIVPDFRVYREGFDCVRNLELKRCFGVQDQPPLNPNMDPGVVNNNSGNVEPMDQSYRRRVPKWTEIRATTK